MFSLQRLLGKEDKFFDLLEAGAEEARASVDALAALIEKPETIKNMDGFVASRRREKQIVTEISEALCVTFITAFEREDIEALSQRIYRIPKTVEKIGERILLAPQFVQGVDLSKHVAIMREASVILVDMIREMRKGMNLEKTHAQNLRLQALEGQADKMMINLLRDLYSGNRTPLQAIFLKDLYELLEKVADRFRDAGNVINQIVLKNS